MYCILNIKSEILLCKRIYVKKKNGYYNGNVIKIMTFFSFKRKKMVLIG